MDADPEAVAELELWHQVWDDTVLETLDYTAATKAADEAIRTRTPGTSHGPALYWNPQARRADSLERALRRFYIPDWSVSSLALWEQQTSIVRENLAKDYARKTDSYR